ncbi:NADH-quinone oxidoreductase subunit NuoN [Beijerinckia indica]|uniref:NADH-quinone oxidoreductase subunit N n=1 Tax=Beijerinckia indica subsp. indica (strain ATCC 9039 / DSM 1715 / NCIMB 8712) TaxID=395963 RepID=NUON_BEII9|nr:NADH-quinone oxidoreductase subunit NuoN [Beijerinckia indica]B2IHV3.1 RecName: Full=NADH-quinone oxidoreductase subunit N; AltName: Full=NADH dehydrogenase I subunit N; AltName: Full=NDH-1 subunit N [Beijerinckia indica subsp. indica ATCC 9039]ACB95996.1 proton-translocating NADH-quinone oxidoreductase, chain N [Beijerinckia indica subsp. indica ATCC 9039]
MTPLPVVLAHALPELILAGGVLLLILIGAIRGKDSDGPMTELAVGLLGIAILTLVLGTKTQAVLFDGSFIDDAFGRFMKVLVLIGSLVSLIMGQTYLAREKIDKFEFPILILLSTLGMLMLISATGLIALYLGLELMSLALYVIAAFHRDDVKASEAGLKYFVLGALSSGMLLYGASLIYGFAGTVNFTGIATALHGETSLGVVFGLVFLTAGLAFKMSTVPFHMWTPDVYEGAPTPVTAFFASAPKLAAIAITMRIMITAFAGIKPQWQQIIVFISILSMALGSFAAIGQTNIKRLMAYSSIGHMGFALVGLAAGTETGIQGVLAYMAIYLVMTLGTFAAILSMRVNGVNVEQISDLAGLARTRGSMAFFLAIMMFSLAGIPPLAGFFAKWYVFNAAIQAHLYPLAVIGVLCSTVGAYYYLRIVKVMYFDDPAPAFDRPTPTLAAVLIVTGLAVLLLCVYPGSFVEATTVAARSLF